MPLVVLSVAGDQLPLNQRVAGSSPIDPTCPYLQAEEVFSGNPDVLSSPSDVFDQTGEVLLQQLGKTVAQAG